MLTFNRSWFPPPPPQKTWAQSSPSRRRKGPSDTLAAAPLLHGGNRAGPGPPLILPHYEPANGSGIRTYTAILKNLGTWRVS